AIGSPLAFAESGLKFGSGRVIASHMVRGCQTRKKRVNATIEVMEAMMSTSQGPWSVETRNWGTAKQTPVTRMAGQIWIIPRNPAKAQMSQNGMMTEKKGS